MTADHVCDVISALTKSLVVSGPTTFAADTVCVAQVLLSREPASRQRKRASLYQPVVLRIAPPKKTTAAVLLSVSPRSC
jgi:hypothetical protein